MLLLAIHNLCRKISNCMIYLRLWNEVVLSFVPLLVARGLNCNWGIISHCDIRIHWVLSLIIDSWTALIVLKHSVPPFAVIGRENPILLFFFVNSAHELKNGMQTLCMQADLVWQNLLDWNFVWGSHLTEFLERADMAQENIELFFKLFMVLTLRLKLA